MKQTLLLMATACAVAAPCVAYDWYADAEALYWKPAHCPMPIAEGEREDGSVETVKTFKMTGDYDWGVRLRVGLMCDKRFSDLAYHWIETTDHSKPNINGLSDVVLPFEQSNVTDVKGSLNTRYQGLDWRFGYELSCGGCATIHFFGDVRWVQLNVDIAAQGMVENNGDSLNKINHNVRYSAGGFGTGVEGHLPLWCNLSVTARMGLTALIGDLRLHERLHEGEEQVKRDSSETAIVPLFDMQLALVYATCWCGMEWEAKVGYELNYLLNVVPYWTSIVGGSETEVSDFPISSCQDFGYGGLVLGIGVNF